MSLNKRRPVNLDLMSIRQPITAISSIFHRLTGVVLFLGLPLILWLLAGILGDNESYERVSGFVVSGVGKVLLWGLAASLSFHVIAGLRHLLMDLGIGESLEGGRRGAIISLVSGVILAAVWGVLLW